MSAALPHRTTGRIECNWYPYLQVPPWIVVAFMWLLGLTIAVMPLYSVLRTLPSFTQPDYLIPLIFLLVLSACGWFVTRAALMDTRQWRYGWGAVFETSTAHGVPGAPIEGTIRHPRLATFGEFEVVLVCRREAIGNDDTRPRSPKAFSPSSAVWYEQKRVGVMTDDAGAGVPVSFQLPAEFPGSRALGASSHVYWRLEARPPLAGVVMFFDIPVFRSAADAESAAGVMASIMRDSR